VYHGTVPREWSHCAHEPYEISSQYATVFDGNRPDMVADRSRTQEILSLP
jgi:hypothetical protein